ncbi:MAG: T9SS type A sorting domain-containing protein [Bacteroidia bacterium]
MRWKYNCEYSDSFDVELNKLPSIDLGGNRDLCKGDSILIKPAISAQIIDFDWSSGDTTIDVWVKKEGAYVLNIVDSKNCENFDNIQVTERDNPVLMIPSDSFYCEGDSLLIQVGNYLSIQWSNNSVDSFAYLQKGNYWVKVENEFGCQKTDSISISEIENVDANYSYKYVDEQKVEFKNESKNQAESYWKLDNGIVLMDSASFVHWFKNEGDYTVWLVAKNYCSTDSVSKKIAITKSSLDYDVESSTQVYPNPFENQVVIRSENEVSEIRMNSITGKEIGINTTFSGFSYIVEIPDNTPSGIYNLSYTKNGVRVSKTLIKR